MRYYKLLDNLYIPPNRWFLGEINFDGKWDFWKFIKTGEVEVPSKELYISVREEGIPLDFTMADFELLIINEKVAGLFSKDEVQLIPLKIKGYTSESNYYLMCIKNEIDCVDEMKSVFDKWEVGNSIRPDLAGEYKTFYKLIVNPERSIGNNIFRIKNYHPIKIISEDLKKKFEKYGITGVKYQKVTG